MDRADEWDLTLIDDPFEADKLDIESLFDVVVLDVKMSGKSGLDLLAGWKDGVESLGYEVIMVTGMSDDRLKIQALKLGATDLLYKPIVINELLARIESALRVKEYRDSLLAKTRELKKINDLYAEELKLRRQYEEKLRESVKEATENRDTLQQKSTELKSINELYEEELNLRKQYEEKLRESVSELHDQNVQLATLATRDKLTGLFNRRHFDSKLEEYSLLSARFGQYLSCIMCDLDHFKKVNDEHGHQSGDRVIEVVSGILSAGVRKTDVAARYGGEEFVILLPDTALSQGMNIAEKLRSQIEEVEVDCGDLKLKITISMGVSTGIREEQLDLELIARADKALYMAKKGGRNQVRST